MFGKSVLLLQRDMCCALRCSVMSNSQRPHGLQPARLLGPWGFSRQEYCSGWPCPPQGDLPDPGIEPRSPALKVGSLPSEPPRKPQRDIMKYLQMTCMASEICFKITQQRFGEGRGWGANKERLVVSLHNCLGCWQIGRHYIIPHTSFQGKRILRYFIRQAVQVEIRKLEGKNRILCPKQGRKPYYNRSH